jgi:hypothetical protein
MRVLAKLERIVSWYARAAYERWEGGSCVPFYCDPRRVGGFAVDAGALARGTDRALFQLLVTFAFYQARRDVDIMTLQRSMPRRTVAALSDTRRLQVLVEQSRCELVASSVSFDRCSVTRDFERDRGWCEHRPRTPCHVKDASVAMRRMGDMGRVPTSAYLHLREAGGFGALFEGVARETRSPIRRAGLLVERIARIYRIGPKLATMFVSAISAPELARGLTPWAPAVQGSMLVLIDANVSHVISAIAPRAPRQYEARAAWLRTMAAKVDLKRIHRNWPKTSPRLVQQAIYLFRSRSNRLAYGDPCRHLQDGCAACVPEVCPFVG